MPSATPGVSARSIAVVRALDGIGDMLCAVPALRALRAGLPDATIALVGLPSAAEFVRRFPACFDELVAFPGFPGLPEVPPDVEALPPFLLAMQGRRFDLALQMHGSGSYSNPFTVLLGARRTAGFYLPGQYRPDGDFIPYPEDRHELRRLTALTDSLGMPDAGEDLEWPVTAADRVEMARAAGGRLAGGYAVLHPGAKQDTRRWPAERFATAGDRLADAGLQPVLTGTPSDAPITRAVASAMRAPALDLAGATTLGALGALVEGARLVVTNDTGVSHIAAALRVPSVVVFSASDPRRWAPLDADLHRVVHPASSRGDSVRPAEVERVLAEVERQLRREAGRVA